MNHKQQKKMTIQNYNGAILISAMKFKRLITMRYSIIARRKPLKNLPFT